MPCRAALCPSSTTTAAASSNGYRDTFAAAEREAARTSGEGVYQALFAEMPAEPSPIVVLPHFSTTGPPEFIADSSGVMVGLRLETTRGDILKAVIESTMFYLRACVEPLPVDVTPKTYHAVGGGSRSDAWLQVAADILGCPLTRTRPAEAGTVGGAILAGVANEAFSSPVEGRCGSGAPGTDLRARRGDGKGLRCPFCRVPGALAPHEGLLDGPLRSPVLEAIPGLRCLV